MSERDDDRHEPDDLDPDAPASAEEVAASQRLRDALEGDVSGGAPAPRSAELDLAVALRAAWAPAALSAEENRAVLAEAASAEEQELARQLRDALEGAREPSANEPDGASLARALRLAFAPPAIDEAEHRAIVDAALRTMSADTRGADVVPLRRGNTVVRVAFGIAAGGLALAASVVFVITSAPMHGSEVPLARARTTQPLFSEPFKSGETSARIDRIASARRTDFRDNRFTKWGVR